MVGYCEVKEMLDYSPDTGVFVWIKTMSRRVGSGDVAGCINHDGYVVIGANGKSYKAHRLAWLYVYGFNPTGVIDHINRIKNDNRIINLRDINVGENCKNRGVRSDNKSGIPGVWWNKKREKWECYKTIEGKRKHIGYFPLKEQAIIAIGKSNKDDTDWR